MVTKLRFTALAILMFCVTLNGWGQTWTGASSNAWLTTGNWSPASYPTGASAIAVFNINTQPSPGINMNTLGGGLTVGGFTFGTGATTARTITNSSGSLAGTLTFAGTTINSAANTIIWNNSPGTHSLTSGGAGMTVALGNSSDNIVYIDSSGGITISAVISGASRKLTKSGNGTGVLLLTAVNTYTGGTTVTKGELRLNPSANLSQSGTFTFNGGRLSTTGIALNRTITFASVDLSDNSILTLDGTNAHTVTFTALGTLTSGKTLTITGWTGTPFIANSSSTTTATKGKVFIGSTASLTAAQLSQIRFLNATTSTYYPATQLSTGEIVPTTTLVVTTPASQTAGTPFNVTVTSQDLDGNARTVSQNTAFTLTTNASGGTIGGTTTGTIASGASSATVSGVTLTGVSTTVTLTATRTSGDFLNAGTTGNFTVVAGSGPSITTTPASFGGPFCNSSSNNISVAYTTSGTMTGTYKVQISDASGVFTNSTTTNIIGTGTGTSPISATIPSGLAAGTGYKVRVINDNPATYGTDNGTAFTITAATTPTVSINDPGAAICGNQSYTFTPTPASLGGGTASYQWTLNGSAGAASGSTYSSSSWNTGNTVQAVLTVTGGCVTSTTASSNTVTITATTPVTPSVTIASNAASNTACAGTSVTFTPTPTNGGTPTYQWQVNSGTTTSGASFSSSALANGDVVKCTMTSTATCVTASTASATPITMTINALPSSASGLSNQTICGSGNVVFSVNDPGAGSTIEWSTNGTSNNDGTGAGGSGAVTKTKAVTAGTPITEYARISNSSGCKSAAWVSATGTGVVAPAISANPADATVAATSTATFTVTATGAASYSWYESTDGGATWSASPLTTTGIYTVSGATLTVTPGSTALNGYRYRVVVNGNSPCTTVTSTAAIMTVTAGPCVSSNFDAATTLPAGWGGTSVNDAVSGHFSSSPNCRAINSTTNTLITPSANYPTSINFYLDGSSVQTLTLAYQVGSTTGTWTNLNTWSSSTAGANISYTLTGTPTTSANVYFRFSSGGNTIYIDDVAIYCGAGVANIDVTGNGVDIADGTTATSTTDFTQFANTTVGASSTRTFVISNNGGSGTINLTGTPKVAISGSTAFAVTTQPASAALTNGQSTNFVVTFTPTNTTTQTATISISNDDPDAAEQTYTFNVSGTGAYLATSTITESSTTYNNGTPATKIDYTAYQSTPAVGQAIAGTIQTLRFNINDLGGGDAQPTILTGINFTVKDAGGTNQIGQIRHAVLATSSNSIKAVATITGTELQFSGLSAADFTAADGSSLTYILRVSYKNTGITDNTKFVYKVSAATASATGSTFAAADAGGATSDVNTGNNLNRINVTADRIVFSTQPSGSSISVALPSFTVAATDANGIVDADATNTITLTTSSGSNFSASASYTLSSGQVSITNVVYSAVKTNETITATTTGLTTNSVTSTSFNISNVATGTYRSASNGVWSSSAGNNTATWQQFNGSSWVSSSYPSTSTTNDVYILHDITLNGTNTAASIIIDNGGNLHTSTITPTFGDLLVKDGGTFTKEGYNKITGTLEVEDGGTFIWNSNNTSARSTTVWNGTEKFHPNSNFEIWKADATDYLLIDDINAVSEYPSAGGYCFGNIKVNCSTGKLRLLPAGFVKNLAAGNVVFTSNSDNQAWSSGNFTTTINGDLIIESTYNQGMTLLTTANTASLTVNGNVVHSSSQEFRLANSSTSNTVSVTMNVNGNVTVNGSGKLSMDIGSSANATVALNVKGDVSVVSTGSLQNTNANKLASVTFNGTGDGLTAATTQTIDIASTVATRNQYIAYNVANGAYVQLANQNFDLGKNSTVTVSNGGTLDFGFTGSTALNITYYSTGSAFTSATGSTLKITSPNGCNNTSGTVGNVQTSIAPVYNQTANFWFIGKANQSTGTIFGAGGNADRNIYVKLADNTISLTPVVQTSIGSGGKVEVQKGIVVNTATVDFIGGNGKLIMTDGIYQNAETAGSVPVLGNSSAANYTLTGGTVELNAAADQILKGGVDYYSLTFSNGGTKTLSSGLPANSLNGLVTVKDAAILDVANNDFSGDAGLTMLNTGRFRMSMLGVTLPQLTGVNFPYTLTGGTVELYGTSSTQTQSLRGTYGSSQTITYNNVDINAIGANVAAGGANVVASAGYNVNGTMNVNSPACFQLGSNFTISGTGAFNVLAGATFKYGGTIAASGATGNIQTTTRSFPTTASYGFVGSLTQTTGTGLPAQMVNMYLDKTAASNTVTLSQSTTVTNSLTFYKGIITTGANKVTINAAATVSGASATTGWVNGNLEKYLAAATATKDFEIGDAAAYTPVNLTFAGNNNGTGSLTAATTGTDHPQVSSSGVNSASSVNRYWSLTNNNVTGFGTYSATFNFITADIDAAAVSQTANFIVAKYNSATWAQPTLGTRTSTSTQITGGTDFGDYQIGIIVSGYVWTGAANTHNWGTAGNWQAGLVPPSASTSDITIQTTNASNYPTLPSSYVLGKVTMNDNATLDLGGYTLDVKGNWFAGTSAGSTVSGAGALVLSGTAQQTINGKTTFSTLRLNNSNGATTSGATINVTTALELQAGAFNATGATVTLKSTATTHAIFNDFGAPVGSYTGTYTGSINAERYYRATSANSYNQHYMGSPVANATLAQFGAGTTSGAVTPTADCSETQLDQSSVYGSVFSYNESTGSTCPMKSWTVKANSAAATPAQGYSVAKTGAGTLTVSGTPNTATSYAVAGLTNSNWTKGTLQHPSTTAFGSGWHMVSNPYNATLDLTSITPPAGFDNQIQVWDVIQGQYYTLTGTKLIAPFQAFFVHKTSPGGSATYTIDGNWRTATPATFYAQSIPEQLTITATNTGNQLYDVTTVGFNSDATDQFDPQFDANKLTGSIGRHNLSTQNNGYELNTNILHSIAETSTVNLTFEPGQAGTYTLTFDGLNSFDPTSYIMLEDKQLNTMHDVRSGDYTFTATAQDDWNRFVLHFTPKAEIATTDQQCETLGAINVTQPGTANWNYTITDNQSNTIASGTLNEATPIAVNTPTGTYTLTLTDNNNYQVVKTVTVNGTTPIVAAFSPSTTTTTVNTDVAFNSTTTATDYYWDFGDGTTATGQNAIHSYADTGTYTVSLIVISANGCSNTTTQTVTVNAEVQTGLNNLNNNQNISIWSNGNTVYVDFSRITRTDATIEIYNVLGQQLVNEKYGRSSIFTKAIGNIEAAYVIVKVKQGEATTTKKVLVTNVR